MSFTRAVEVDLGADVLFGVAPHAVIALLKIVAYMDDRQRRRKDLDDLRVLFRWYEATADRIFSGEVFAAELEGIEDAAPFFSAQISASLPRTTKQQLCGASSMTFKSPAVSVPRQNRTATNSTMSLDAWVGGIPKCSPAFFH